LPDVVFMLAIITPALLSSSPPRLMAPARVDINATRCYVDGYLRLILRRTRARAAFVYALSRYAMPP